MIYLVAMQDDPAGGAGGDHRLVAGRSLALVGGIALAVAVVSSLVASSGEVGSVEEWFFRAANDLPDWLEPVMWVFQLAGLLLVPGLVAVGALLWRRYWLALALILMIPLKLFVEKAVVKQLVERERPGTTICAGDETCADFRDVPLEGLSFVSGHAVIAWGVATLLWPFLPGRWRWVPVAIAVLNSVARVYLGAHNPLDVVGGGAVGVLIGVVLLVAVDALERRWPTAATRSHELVGSTA
jgi:undecaprenyl-diphosphatase